MPEQLKIPTSQLKKSGIIDLDGLYKNMQRWFYDNQYYFEEPTTRLRPGSASGVQYEYKWIAWRKVNAYVKYNISVYMYLWDVEDIEVIKEGKKVKLTKCRIMIEFSGNVELDYTNMFGKSKFGKVLFNIYNNMVLQKERGLAMWWDELYYRIYKLQTITKEYLDMESKGNAYYDIW